MDLTAKKCVPCEGGVESFSKDETEKYMAMLKPGWETVGDKKIKRLFKFRNFKETMEFVNKVAGIAEEEGHHPDITIVYNKVTIELTTHAIGGLSTNDFIMGAKIERL